MFASPQAANSAHVHTLPMRRPSEMKASQRNEADLYLCDLISGVPFHSQQDLGEDLRHVEAVLSGTAQGGENNSSELFFCAANDADTFLQPFGRAAQDKQAHLCLQRKSFSCSVISDSGSRLHTCRSWSLSLSVSGLSRASLLLCVTIMTGIDVSTVYGQHEAGRGGGGFPREKKRDQTQRCDANATTAGQTDGCHLTKPVWHKLKPSSRDMFQFACSSMMVISGYLTGQLKWSNSSSRQGVSCEFREGRMRAGQSR